MRKKYIIETVGILNVREMRSLCYMFHSHINVVVYFFFLL